MKGKGRLKLLLTLLMFVLIIALFVGGVALAQGGYNLNQGTVAGGGHFFSTGGSDSLGGSIGQPDAGAMSGGDYALGGGFWGGGELTLPTGSVYLPIVIKN